MITAADEYVSWALFVAVLRILNKAGGVGPLWLSSGFNRDISEEPAAAIFFNFFIFNRFYPPGQSRGPF